MATIRQNVGKLILGISAVVATTIGASLILDGVLMTQLSEIRAGSGMLLIAAIAATGWVMVNCMSFNDQFEAGYSVGYERGCADTSKKFVVRPMLIKTQGEPK